MKRMPLLQLIAAAALLLLQGTNPVRADDTAAALTAAPAHAAQTTPAEPVQVAWDRVGAVA